MLHRMGVMYGDQLLWRISLECLTVAVKYGFQVDRLGPINAGPFALSAHVFSGWGGG